MNWKLQQSETKQILSKKTCMEFPLYFQNMPFQDSPHYFVLPCCTSLKISPNVTSYEALPPPASTQSLPPPDSCRTLSKPLKHIRERECICQSDLLPLRATT